MDSSRIAGKHLASKRLLVRSTERCQTHFVDVAGMVIPNSSGRCHELAIACGTPGTITRENLSKMPHRLWLPAFKCGGNDNNRMCICGAYASYHCPIAVRLSLLPWTAPLRSHTRLPTAVPFAGYSCAAQTMYELLIGPQRMMEEQCWSHCLCQTGRLALQF